MSLLELGSFRPQRGQSPRRQPDVACAPPSSAPSTASARGEKRPMGEFQELHSQDKIWPADPADAQQIVLTRVLYCVHDRAGRPSRMQGI